MELHDLCFLYFWSCLRWIHCSLADSFTSGTVLFSVMLFALLVERWCLIKVFRIAVPVWGVSFVPSGSSQNKRSFGIFFHVCPNELLNTQWRCKSVENSWNSYYVTVLKFIIPQLMTLLALCAVKPSQGITGVELWWSSVRRFHRRWIPFTTGRLDMLCVMCYLSIRHSTWLNIRIITSQLYWKSNRTYQTQKSTDSACAINRSYVTMAA